MTHAEYKKAVGQYLAALPSMKKSAQTVRAYSLSLRKYDDYLSRTEGTEACPLSVISFRSDLFASGVGNNTIRQYLVNLHAFFEWCVRTEQIEANPVKRKEIPEAQRVEYDLLSLEEIEKIINEPLKKRAGRTEKRNRAAVLMLTMTGVRSDELRSLRIGDLDFEQNTMAVLHGKGDKYRRVPFPSLVRDAVMSYLEVSAHTEAQDYLFGTEADENGHRSEGTWKKMSSAALLGVVNRYTEKKCGHSVGVHTLRHAYASLCDHHNVPLRQIQLSMGHSNSRVTESVYIDVLDRAKVAASINTVLDKYGVSV